MENEKALNLLRNLHTNFYLFKKIDKIRYLGAMEALLLVLGVLDAGQPLQYLKETKSFFGFKYDVTESYENHILRLTRKTISVI